MQITYKNKKIADICCNPDKHIKEFGKKIIENLKLALVIMTSMENLSDFQKPAHIKYRLEKLKNMNGLMSIRLDQKYRLTFYNSNDVPNAAFIEINKITIENLSNHYKN